MRNLPEMFQSAVPSPHHNHVARDATQHPILSHQIDEARLRGHQMPTESRALSQSLYFSLSVCLSVFVSLSLSVCLGLSVCLSHGCLYLRLLAPRTTPQTSCLQYSGESCPVSDGSGFLYAFYDTSAIHIHLCYQNYGP